MNKSIIKDLIPPVVVKKLTGLFYGWSGNYANWQEAANKTSGYNSDIIFDKVKNALLKVKNGEAVAERDSVLFDKVQYSFPLLSALQYVALNDSKGLSILDFGGSMGSSYYQNKNFLKNINPFSWNIVEQKHFVEEGQKTFADEHLRFFYDIESCLKANDINVLLLSSVLQYLEKPYDFLDNVLTKNFPYIIIDRAPVLLEGADRITIQTVPKNIYEAEYPCWLLNEKNILNKISTHYEVLFDHQTEETINLSNGAFKAFFLKRKGI